MPEELEPLLKAAYYYVARTFGWWGILYLILAAFALFLLLKLLHLLIVVVTPAAFKIEVRSATTGEAVLLAWRRQGKPWLWKYVPAFLASYIIVAGLAIVLGRFDADAALVGCPAVAVGASYFFGRLRRD